VKTWITCQEAAAKYDLDRRTIASFGTSEAVRTSSAGCKGRQRLYSVTDLDRWIPIYRQKRGIPEPGEPVEVECLRCEKPFMTRNRKLHHICPTCAVVNSSGRYRSDGDWVYADCDGGMI